MLKGLIYASWYENQLVIDPTMLIINPTTRKVEHTYRLVGYDLMDELLELLDLNKVKRNKTGDLHNLGVIDQHDELVFELMVLIDSTVNAWDGMVTLTKLRKEILEDELLELEILKRLNTIKKN